MKVNQLEGVALDWAVSKCEGRDQFFSLNLPKHKEHCFSRMAYSTDWSLGGPIIEQERIAVWFEKHDDVDCGLPIWFAQDGYAPAMQGPTPLIAAMRCYVAGMLGDEIEVPDELMEGASK